MSDGRLALACRHPPRMVSAQALGRTGRPTPSDLAQDGEAEQAHTQGRNIPRFGDGGAGAGDDRLGD